MAFALVGVVACSVGNVCTAPEQTAKESQIKAAFIYNFTKFVEWPADRFANAEDPFVLGMFGDSLLQRELEAIVRDRKVNGRAIVVRQVVTAQEVRAVHVVFVVAAEDARFAAILSSVEDRAVLTIGESTSFLAHGGTIRFLVEEGKLRFEINAAAAERAHLKVSSQLQKLATTVQRTPEG